MLSELTGTISSYVLCAPNINIYLPVNPHDNFFYSEICFTNSPVLASEKSAL